MHYFYMGEDLPKSWFLVVQGPKFTKYVFNTHHDHKSGIMDTLEFRDLYECMYS